MSISYKKTVAKLSDFCTIEEAEPLWEWLLANPSGKLNLKTLQHPHSAVLQVMMANRVSVSVWPDDAQLTLWLQAALLDVDG